MAKSAKSVAKAKQPAPEAARILCIDIGGTGIKIMVVSTEGEALSERLREETPQPATPKAVLAVVAKLAGEVEGKVSGQALQGAGKTRGRRSEVGGRKKRAYDYVACGFPGVVKRGTTFTAHNLSPEWVEFPLQQELEKLLGVPTRVANDAAVQGLGAVRGEGVELCITLGTGMGSSLFVGGVLVPGLELGHHPFRDSKCYEEFLGRDGLKKLGKKKWNKRVKQAIATAERLFNYDHIYIGGGNNKKIEFKLPENATLVENLDGLRGGAALWRDVVGAHRTLVKQ